MNRSHLVARSVVVTLATQILSWALTFGYGFQRAVQRLFNLIMICVIPFSAVLILARGHILSLLRYPDSYRRSIPVLMLMGAALILWDLSQAVSTTLIASDRQGVFSKITGIAALASVPLVLCYRLSCLCWDDLLMLQQFTRRFSRA